MIEFCPIKKTMKMDLIHIDSFQHLKEQLSKTPNMFLLLYKSGSETSDCALQNALKASNKDIAFSAADVSKVRDIHPEFGIKTAPILLNFQNEQLVNTYKGCNDVSFYHQIFAEDYFMTNSDGEQKSQKRVTVYSTPSCSWCNTLKTHLKHHQIRYTDIDVSKDMKAAEEMTKRSGQQGVPQTDINGQIIVGFDKNKINSLLGIQ